MFKPVGKCFDFSMFKMHALFVSTFSAFRSELSWTLITGFDSLTTHYCPPLVECFIMVKMTSHCALLHEKQISKKLKRNNHLLTQICTPTLYHLLNIELFTKATSHQSRTELQQPHCMIAPARLMPVLFITPAGVCA